jgi:ABC-type phosphate/phosphonate transport system substrate-binding protein
MTAEARFIANARMYAVTPAVEEAWRALLARISAQAGVDLTYETYPAPAPLETLWARSDLGCVFMCGYPIACGLAAVMPLAAPVPSADWAGGQAVYRSDLIVRADAPYRTLADTFGGRTGWTVAHSHSGFNAWRHHLLPFRTAERPRLYREAIGPLVTARAILDAVREGRIDVGPLDAYWHGLIRRHAPALVAGIRVLDATATAPMPVLVASPTLPAAAADRLRAALAEAGTRDWFAPFAAELMISGFAPVTAGSFVPTLAWDAEAKAAGYPEPA